MAKIILIETSTTLCSVALAVDGKAVCSRESDTPKAHASLTAVFVREVLGEAGLAAGGCDAVCVSAGPGSYTGLRVGVSTAKGLCFAAGLPLLSICTLDILAAQAVRDGHVSGECRHIVPMIDARRMEVYTAAYDAAGHRQTDVAPLVVEAGSFGRELSEGETVFIGDAADKCREVVASPAARFVQTYPHASAMAPQAERLFSEGRFEDCAYFEPFYLKQFMATTSKKKLF